MTFKEYIMKDEGKDNIVGDIIADAKRAGDDVGDIDLMRSRLRNLPDALAEYNRKVRNYKRRKK